MKDNVYGTSIEYMQIVDERGNADYSLFPKDLEDSTIVGMYRNMLYARALDAKMLSLQRQGRAVTYAPLLGEEATQIGSATAMRGSDIFVPAFRQHGVFLTRGMPPELMFIYWRGFEEGDEIPKAVNGTPIIVPVATQMLHAVGLAFAQKYKATGAKVVAYVGDGGTSEGDFYEALNFAGVWKLPLVAIIENNQWAISVPRKMQSAAKTLAQKAVAAGIDSVQVDGNDVVAVYQATKDALAREGPMVIECITYRMGLHTTADDPTKYRSDTDVEEWKAKDPVSRIRAYLTNKKLWNDDLEKEADEELAKKIDDAVEKAEQFKPDPRSMYQSLYSYMPAPLEDELEEAEKADFWQGDPQ